MALRQSHHDAPETAEEVGHASIWIKVGGDAWDTALATLGENLIRAAAKNNPKVLTQTDLGRVTGIGRRERVYRILQTLGILEEIKKVLSKKRAAASRNDCMAGGVQTGNTEKTE